MNDCRRAPPALAEPSGAGVEAKARCPQTGDCVANVSARPCATGLLAGAEFPAQLKRSLKQALVHGLADIRGDDLVQPRRSVVLRPLPGEVVAHGCDDLG